MAASSDLTMSSQNINLIDELESSFLNCMSLMTSQEQYNVQDSEETKTSIENAMQRFLELSRQTEAFFLRKRMLITYQKPDLLVKDEILDLKAELVRKEQLLERHAEKFKRCQLLMKEREGTSPSVHAGSGHQSAMQSVNSHQTPPPQPQGLGATGAMPVGHLPPYSQPHHLPGMGGQQGGSMAPGSGPYQGYPTTMHGQGPGGMPGPGMQSHSMGMGPRPQPPPSYPQGPLAYLEQTTSNIGLPDRR
ncbi:mediator of RNA polymerase II transcription subunit 28-like [Mya arenaria]|uniref:mediator of RNA polymerase II transcription subunit 28-like n=1 Tax=Mya arenaria TaxID=6604 RepID=UPI0022DEEE62|nr:mediator of RNA polymerase II transcription subunit 28-like [Mya arenaria]